MKTLNLTFKGSLGQAMEKLANYQIFFKNNEELFATPVSAKYVDTIPTVLFDDKKNEPATA